MFFPPGPLPFGGACIQSNPYTKVLLTIPLLGYTGAVGKREMRKMAQSSWRDRAISPKQLATIDKVKGEKVLADLDETLLDILADIESEVPVTQGQASDLMDALFALPRKPRVFKEETAATLVSTWEARKAASDAAYDVYEAATKKAEAAAEAAGGTTAEGACTKCNKIPGSDRSSGGYYTVGKPTEGACNNLLEARYSDYSDYYYCSGTEVGTAATAAAGVLTREAASLYKPADKARSEADEFQKGDWVVNARGRKIPKGTKGQVVFAKYDGQYGPSVLLLVDGQKVWTAMRNVEHIATPEV